MKIKKLTPELMVDNMPESIDFYEEILDLALTVKVPEKDPFFVIMAKDGIEIMLYKREQFTHEIPKLKGKEIGATAALYIEISKIEELYKNIRSKVRIIQKIYKTEYGSTEFSIEDNSGYVIILAENS